MFSACPHKNDLISVIEDLSAPISQVEMDRAEQIVMMYAMQLTRQELDENKLTSLLPFEENGIIYTRGRVGVDALKRILGVDKLSILSSKSRLAKLVMIKSLEEGTGFDHRGELCYLGVSILICQVLLCLL